MALFGRGELVDGVQKTVGVGWRGATEGHDQVLQGDR